MMIHGWFVALLMLALMLTTASSDSPENGLCDDIPQRLDVDVDVDEKYERRRGA